MKEISVIAAGQDPVKSTAAPTKEGPIAANKRPKLKAKPEPKLRCELGNISGSQTVKRANTPLVKKPSTGSSARNTQTQPKCMAMIGQAMKLVSKAPRKKNSAAARRLACRAIADIKRQAARVPKFISKPESDAQCWASAKL